MNHIAGISYEGTNRINMPALFEHHMSTDFAV